MSRKLLLLMLLTLPVGTLNWAFNIPPTTASQSVHNVDTGLSYATIQEAINANETLNGHTILVDAGVYYENVVLNKTLSLIGENRDFTVIDANGTGNCILMQADYSMVESFTVQNGGFGIAILGNSTQRYVGNAVLGNVFRNDSDAIGLSSCDKNVIANNTFGNSGFNIIVGWVNPFASWDVTSNNNTITGNNMTQGIVGILILDSKHNVVSENSVSNMTDKGIIFLSKGMSYPYVTPIVTNNSLCNNVIVNCTSGLILSGQDLDGVLAAIGLDSCNNITGNVIQHNKLGLYVFDEGNNTIMNNVLADNVFGVFLESQNNLLRGNQMSGNIYNFAITEMSNWFGPDLQYNSLDTSNTANGKPMYYLVNQTNLNINPSTYPDVGLLALRNCVNITIENMTLSNNGNGISLYDCTNVTIERTTIQENIIAISALSNNLVVRDCVLRDNLHGLDLLARARVADVIHDYKLDIRDIASIAKQFGYGGP